MSAELGGLTEVEQAVDRVFLLVAADAFDRSVQKLRVTAHVLSVVGLPVEPVTQLLEGLRLPRADRAHVVQRGFGMRVRGPGLTLVGDVHDAVGERGIRVTGSFGFIVLFEAEDHTRLDFVA